MKMNRFTIQELHLLADSLYWEFTVFEKVGGLILHVPGS